MTSLAGLLLWPAGASILFSLHPWELAVSVYSIGVFLLFLFATSLLRKLLCSGKSALLGAAFCAVAFGAAGLYHGGLDYLDNWANELSQQTESATHSVEKGTTNGPALVATLASSLTVFFLFAF